jgi:hypothetical protein
LGDEEEHTTEEQPTRYPIDGVLDLHEFHPQGLGSLVPEYLRACREEDIPAASLQSMRPLPEVDPKRAY